jgi:hypothetical protein
MNRQIAWVLSAMALNATGASAQTAPSIDLYGATLEAIRAEGWQPAAAKDEFPYLRYRMERFTGGQLLQQGDMNYDVPTSASLTPTLYALLTKKVVNCPSRNGATINVLVSMEATVNDYLKMTSDKTVSNSSTEAFSGTTTLTVSYKPPATGGVAVAASQSFTYGTTQEHGSSSSSGAETGSSNSVTYSDEVPLEVPAGYSRTLDISTNVVAVSGARWSADFKLDPKLNVSAGYVQMLVSQNIYVIASKRFLNTEKPANFVNLPAGGQNAAGIPVIAIDAGWTKKQMGVLASPDGRFAAVPDLDGLVHMVTLNRINETLSYKTFGSATKDGNKWTYFGFYGMNGSNCGVYQSPTINTSAPTKNGKHWFTNGCATVAGVTDGGELVTGAQNASGWTSGAPDQKYSAIKLPELEEATYSPEKLLRGKAFTVGGTYDQRSYSAEGKVTVYDSVPLTSTEQSDCDSQGGRSPQSGAGAGGTVPTAAVVPQSSAQASSKSVVSYTRSVQGHRP